MREPASPAGDLPGTALCAVPLVRRMLTDPNVRFCERRVDEEWAYQRVCPSVKGWNPWSGTLFYAAHSALQEWRSQPEQPLRALNEGDLLLPEVLFAVHDYLHVWSTRVLQTLAPSRELGYGPIHRENVEALVFLLLLTEAAATAGVDYWYLSTVRLNSELPVGTALRNLTVSYREDDLEEHRRANPALNVQDPAFFRWLCRLYTTGVAEGFDNQGLQRSALTFKWLNKELRYGELQREYARGWLQHLGGTVSYPTQRELRAPVASSAPWQRELIEQLGTALWQLVRLSSTDPTPPAPQAETWTAPHGRPFDPRFENLATLDDPRAELAERGVVPGTFLQLFAQAISELDFHACGASLQPCASAVLRAESVPLLFELVRHYPKIARGEPGPRDLFFLS